jgi:Holliday junction DNA helicase RuvB
MSEEVLAAALALLRERPETAEVLKRITDWEATHYKDQFFNLGWEWDSFEPPIRPQILHLLHLRGILRQAYKSRSGTGYLTADPAQVLKALQVFNQDRVVNYTPEAEGIPGDLFSIVIGYDDVKSMVQRALEKESRIHWLLVGPPASAKTLFLLCLERLPGSGYILGSRMSRAGLSDYLIEFKPRHLLVDEIDKLPPKDISPLLSLCETGRVVETLYGRRREETLKTIVFAAANRVEGLPKELLSRFEVLHFQEYTQPQFTEVCTRLLEREKVGAELGAYIAEQVWGTLRNRDVREALRISRLSETKAEVDDNINILRRYQPARRGSGR